MRLTVKRKASKRPRKTVLASTFSRISKIRKADRIKALVNNLDGAWRRNKLSNLRSLDWPLLSYAIAKWLKVSRKGLKRRTLNRLGIYATK